MTNTGESMKVKAGSTIEILDKRLCLDKTSNSLKAGTEHKVMGFDEKNRACIYFKRDDHPSNAVFYLGLKASQFRLIKNQTSN